MTDGPRAFLWNFIRHEAKRRPLTLEKAAPRLSKDAGPGGQKWRELVPMITDSVVMDQ